MTDDLRRALEDLAARTTAEHSARARAGHGLPIDDMTTCARRRRHRHAAAISAAVLTSVLAVGAAGIALAGWPPDEPLPATPSPTPTNAPETTPIPAPTQDRVVLPPGDPALPFGACGSVVGSPTELPLSGGGWTPAATVTATTVVAGGPVEVTGRISVDWGQGADTGVVRGGGPLFVVTHDGVVVAATELYGELSVAPELYTIDAGTLTTYGGLLPLASCEPSQIGRADGGALPSGDYELRIIGELLPLGDDRAVSDQIAAGTTSAEQVAEQRAADWQAAVSEPVPFTIAGPPPTAAQPPARRELDLRPLSPQPSCGAPAPTDGTGDLFTLNLASTPQTVAAGRTARVEADLTYNGPGRARLFTSLATQFWAVRDGVVVGQGALHFDGYFAVVDIGSGFMLDEAADLELKACAGPVDGSDPLPAGTYTVYPGVQISDLRITTVSGTNNLTTADGGTFSAVLGTPFTLTIE